MSTEKLELISFHLCPFVQRSVITLQEKGVEFDVTYIDLANPPEWFQALSPTGKVPMLRVGDTALFESAVINEYLDETHPPSLHPADPLRRALNRAWIEFASSMLVAQYHLLTAKTEAEFELRRAEAAGQCDRLEAQLGDAPYFNGPAFSLADAAFAPVFTRYALMERLHPLRLFADGSRVAAWSRALLARDSVQRSAPADFDQLFAAYFTEQGGYFAQFLPQKSDEKAAVA